MCNGLRRRNAYGVVEPGTDRALLLYSSSNLIAGGSFGFDARGAHPATLAPPALDAPANIASCLFLPQPDVQVPWMGLGMLLGPVGAQGDSVWVSSLAVYAGRLFAGGNFSWSLALDPDDETGPRRVDGWASMSILAHSRWRRVSPLVDADVTSFAVTPQGLYAAGMFTGVLDQRRHVLLRWDGQHLRGLDHPIAVAPIQPDGYPASVMVLHSDGDTLYLGGRFTRLSDGAPAANLARYDSLSGELTGYQGHGVDGEVRALDVLWELELSS
jgi:hypothetical protein